MTDGTEETFVDDARRYRIDSRIATGGMGEVWRGTDTVLDREVAVKLLKSEYADDATFRSRFETEARHAASLHHPNVAAVFDFGEAEATDGSGVHRPYLVMELVDGQPLSALLRPDQPLDPDVTRDLLGQAAAALGAAHAAGIVHRDVKPANLLVTPDRTVKITDFGIARAAEGMALTETGQVMGTPQYLSPEQAQGSTATPASDVYSLGVVAFECLAGHRPFVAETAVATALAHLRDPVPDLPDAVPADLAAVVRRAMAKPPEERYADGNELAAALRDPAAAAAAMAAAVPAAGAAGAAAASDRTQVMAATGELPVVTDPTPTAAPVDGTDRRRKVPWGWILLALAVVVALVVVAVLANGADEPDDEPDEPTTSQSPRERRTQEPTTAETSEAPESSAPPSEEPTSEEPTSEAPTSEAPTSEAPSETASETTEPTEPTETASETTSGETTGSGTTTQESPAAGDDASPAAGASASPVEGSSS